MTKYISSSAKRAKLPLGQRFGHYADATPDFTASDTQVDTYSEVIAVDILIETPSLHGENT